MSTLAPALETLRNDQSAWPLESGDRMDQAEFHNRYRETPENFKAELIQGIVYVASPVRVYHGKPHSLIVGTHFNYCAATHGCDAYDNTTLIMSDEDEPQPDSSVIILPDYGGQTSVDDEGYAHGAPEHLIEVAASTVSFDLHQKRQTYELAGVREYIVVTVLEPGVHWFVLEDNRFVKRSLPDDGVIRSTMFPGLWLDTVAVLSGDRATLLKTLNEGLTTDEHREFVKQMKPHHSPARDSDAPSSPRVL